MLKAVKGALKKWIAIAPKALALVLAAGALCIGCSQKAVEHEHPPSPAAGEPATFVNKVWQVGDSSGIASGALYVFLSDGTLIITSTRETPMLGTWKQEDGKLIMVEEGIGYNVDVLRLTADEFRIRSHNPGGAVDIKLVPASTGRE